MAKYVVKTWAIDSTAELDLADALTKIPYVYSGAEGMVEQIQEEVSTIGQRFTALLLMLEAKALLTPEEICLIVNTGTGYTMCVADVEDADGTAT